MNALPIVLILNFPIQIQIIYFALCLFIGVAGMRRKMGFWGYFFSSIVLSPVMGLLLVLISGKKTRVIKK